VGTPTGTVTFLFTDIEGSTALWESVPEGMRTALARHDELLRSAIEAHGGYVFQTAGDGVAAAFQRSADAVIAAVDAQRALQAEPWPEGAELRVRMGLHTGEADERDGDYLGPPLNRAARLMAAAHGGQTVISEATAVVLGQVSGIGLVDLGSHRLRGLVHATHVYGVKADGVDWLDLPLATLEATRGNLPRPATEWFGPVAELNRWVSGLRQRRLVTFTGPGGVGKTRLAVEVGALVAGEFPDGVWMVELAPVAEREAVHAAAASTLGVLPQDGMTLLMAILDWLEGRRLLLILDNCEHVLEPATELVKAVVAASGAVTVIATSREPLGVAGEQVVPIPSLGASDGVDLFCDRARLADASQQFSEPDRLAIGAICKRLDGIPLAIELAAARARSLGIEELLARLDDRFRLLRGSGRGSVERHQTLRAAVGWSYQLLAEAEQALFDRLSVFAGSFGLGAAEAVCAGRLVDAPDVVDLLGALVDKSLVTVDRSTTSLRYILMETLRQFGEEGLEHRGETAVVRMQHLAYYVDLAKRAGEMWAGPRGDAALETVRVEWDNLRMAHTTAVATLEASAAQAILDGTFGPAVMDLRFEHGEWAEATLELAAAGCTISPNTFAYAASFAWRGRELDHAVELARRGIGAAPTPDDPSALLCWAYLVLALVTAGRFTEAVDAAPLLEAMALSDEADPLHQLAASAAFLFLAGVGRRERVMQYIKRVDYLAESSGSPPIVATASFVRGMALQILDPPDYAAALASLLRALPLARELRATQAVSGALSGIALATASMSGAEAGAACREALVYSYEARSWAVTLGLLTLALVLLYDEGNPEAACVLLGHPEVRDAVPLQVRAVNAHVFSGKVEALKSEPGADGWMARGAAMDRHEVVRYALDKLETTDTLPTDTLPGH
jgi:predicted ATPase/class 3 adenylate cyclase